MPSSSRVSQTLTALSPLDGRYADLVAPLVNHFSEFALIHARLRVEVRWLVAMAECDDVPDCKRLTKAQRAHLEKLVADFTPADAERVKKIEETTRHDVKAVEVYLAEDLKKQKMEPWIAWLHFGCTSEDINSTSYALMVSEALAGPMAEKISDVAKRLRSLSTATAEMPMLARTHGQPASPTTMGKEIAVFAHRLHAANEALRAIKMTMKFGGATGTFSAWEAACPEANWFQLTRDFLTTLAPDCEALPVTTQIDPHDSLARICFALTQINTILTDLARDFWQYISDGYFTQRKAQGQVGSSTMPHKVNPIDFENAEGNFGLSSAVLVHLATKLPISRLQRDLTDSTVMRSLATAFGHMHLALTNLCKGLDKIDPNEVAMREALERHWEVLAEPLQTCLRRHGVADAYEKLRKVTQGKDIDAATYQEMVKKLPLPAETRKQLARLKPTTYIGRAAELAKIEIGKSEETSRKGAKAQSKKS